MRQIPKKNYFILLLLLLATVGLVFFIRDVYESRDDKRYDSVMNSFITEIKIDDLNDYTLENSPVVIFISNKLDLELNDQEKKYKQFLIDYNLQNLFVYLDISNEEVDVLKQFNDKYNLNLKNGDVPILVVIEEGNVLASYMNQTFSKNDVVDFLTVNGVIEND